MFLYLYHGNILVRNKGFIFASQEMTANVEKSSEYYCSVLLDGSTEKSTFKKTVVYGCNLHHNRADGAFTLETVTSEYF
jgi:hypothetical protein